MRFYWEGYAEVIHLATTARCLPPRRAAPSEADRRRGTGRLHGLWRSVRGRLRRRPS